MDKHLNIFYSYNRDNELIEDNLTRAFILTLKGISGESRRIFLHSLNSIFVQYDFSDASFALQNNIEKNPKDFKNKHILTISSNTTCNYEDDFKLIKKEDIKYTFANNNPPVNLSEKHRALLNEIIGESRPDAWIYSKENDNDYCFLIECKKQEDCIYYPQIMRHAFKNFGLEDIDEIKKCTTKLIWDDILTNYHKLIKNELCFNKQEIFLIENFIQHMSFFEYSIFEGFKFIYLPILTDIKFILKIEDYTGISFANIPTIPDIKFKFENKLFKLNRINEPPEFKFNLGS